MFNYLKENKVGIGILITILPIVWGFTTFLIEAKQKQRAQNYLNFHSTIRSIYDTKDGGKGEYKMNQRASVFELGFYKNYKDFTCREIPAMRNNLTDINTKNEIDNLETRLNCNNTGWKLW